MMAKQETKIRTKETDPAPILTMKTITDVRETGAVMTSKMAAAATMAEATEATATMAATAVDPVMEEAMAIRATNFPSI
jgi:hypothetical protein